jgi:multiple sugar transport system substrate-binding protein
LHQALQSPDNLLSKKLQSTYSRRKKVMTKKLLYLLTLLIAFALILTACGGGAEPAEPAGEEMAGDEKVSLRLWTHQNNAFNAGYEALIDKYQEKNPNVEITLETFEYDLYIQTLQTAMPAGEEADVISLFGTWTSQYAERLTTAPDTVMTIAAAEDVFYNAPLGGFIVDGELYGLPHEFNLEYGGVLVNKTKFEAAGLTYPPQWDDLNDVLSDAKAMTEVDDTGIMNVAGFHFTSGDALFFNFAAGIRQHGGDYWNADHTAFTFNTPEAKATLEWMLAAVNDWGVVDPILFNDEENWVGDAFFEGKVGIGYIGTWAIAEGQANYPDFEDEWDYFWLPSYQGDPIFVADSGWGLTVSPNSEHKEVAWDFVKFVTADDENALSWNISSGTIPALPPVAESDSIDKAMPFVTKALDLLPYGEYLGNMPDRDLVVYEIVYPHLISALQGLESVDDALEAINTEANASFE